jgi:hypothetical protein
MVQMAQRSPSMRATIRDLFLGLQGYTDLDDRVYSRLPRVLLEYVTSFVTGGKGAREAGSSIPELRRD